MAKHCFIHFDQMSFPYLVLSCRLVQPESRAGRHASVIARRAFPAHVRACFIDEARCICTHTTKQCRTSCVVTTHPPLICGYEPHRDHVQGFIGLSREPGPFSGIGTAGSACLAVKCQRAAPVVWRPGIVPIVENMWLRPHCSVLATFCVNNQILPSHRCCLAFGGPDVKIGAR